MPFDSRLSLPQSIAGPQSVAGLQSIAGPQNIADPNLGSKFWIGALTAWEKPQAIRSFEIPSVIMADITAATAL